MDVSFIFFLIFCMVAGVSFCYFYCRHSICQNFEPYELGDSGRECRRRNALSPSKTKRFNVTFKELEVEELKELEAKKRLEEEKATICKKCQQKQSEGQTGASSDGGGGGDGEHLVMVMKTVQVSVELEDDKEKKGRLPQSPASGSTAASSAQQRFETIV